MRIAIAVAEQVNALDLSKLLRVTDPRSVSIQFNADGAMIGTFDFVLNEGAFQFRPE